MTEREYLEYLNAIDRLTQADWIRQNPNGGN